MLLFFFFCVFFFLAQSSQSSQTSSFPILAASRRSCISKEINVHISQYTIYKTLLTKCSDIGELVSPTKYRYYEIPAVWTREKNERGIAIGVDEVHCDEHLTTCKKAVLSKLPCSADNLQGCQMMEVQRNETSRGSFARQLAGGTVVFGSFKSFVDYPQDVNATRSRASEPIALGGMGLYYFSFTDD